MSVMTQLLLMSLLCVGAGAAWFKWSAHSAQKKYGNPPIHAPGRDDRRADLG